MPGPYLSPGVYVEEVPSGARPIEGVGTAIAAFVGFTKTGDVNKPTFVANWTQFANTFFYESIPEGYLAHAIYGYFNNGGGSCYVTRLPGAIPGAEDAAESTKLLASLPTKAKKSIESLSITALEPGVPTDEIVVEVTSAAEGAPEDEFTLIVRRGETGKPEEFENVTLKKKAARYVVDVVNEKSKLVRVAEKKSELKSPAERAPAPGTYPLAAVPTTAVAAISSEIIVGDAAERSGVAGLEAAEDVTMVCCPDLMALYPHTLSIDGVKAVQQAMLDHCERMKDRFAILDCPPGLSPQEIKDWKMIEAGYDSKYGALYYPWIKVANLAGNGETVLVPPSGHMAGIYARSDSERGVHKAPANEVVRGALGLETRITKSEQDSLNPVNINCIRAFPGRGIRVWGARTLSSDKQWQYINVRRLFNFIEESIELGTQWVVFEPNDLDLWERIKRDVRAFLTRVWRDGALFGATPDEAFYVKCDEELNTVEERDAGKVIIEIGLAPVKPAEFVIFRISQWAGGATAAE